jgi:hypothetical protein
LNVTASPDYNAIEAVFSVVKNVFKRKRLGALVNRQPFDLRREAMRAFDVVTPDLVAKCQKRSLNLLKNV